MRKYWLWVVATIAFFVPILSLLATVTMEQATTNILTWWAPISWLPGSILHFITSPWFLSATSVIGGALLGSLVKAALDLRRWRSKPSVTGNREVDEQIARSREMLQRVTAQYRAAGGQSAKQPAKALELLTEEDAPAADKRNADARPEDNRASLDDLVYFVRDITSKLLAKSSDGLDGARTQLVHLEGANDAWHDEQVFRAREKFTEVVRDAIATRAGEGNSTWGIAGDYRPYDRLRFQKDLRSTGEELVDQILAIKEVRERANKALGSGFGSAPRIG